jgi:integrase
LTQALGQAVRWELLAANPAAGAQPPRPRRAAPLVADPALLERLLAATAGSVYELPCALAVATGMRRGELLALRWSDLSPERRQARVVRSLQPTRAGLMFEEPKSRRSRRTVVLPAFLDRYLDAQRRRQSERRLAAAGSWRELGLLIDRGDGVWGAQIRSRCKPPRLRRRTEFVHPTCPRSSWERDPTPADPRAASGAARTRGRPRRVSESGEVQPR